MHGRRRLRQRRPEPLVPRRSERSTPTSRFFSKMTSISVLPTETILNIMEMSHRSTIISAMRTSRSMHCIGARALYASVDVSDASARMFFSTIASRTVLSNFYAHFVRRLSFSVSFYSDKFIIFPIFCETLICLQWLRTLSILLTPDDGEFMRVCMKRFGISRERVSSLTAARAQGGHNMSTRLTLLSVHTIRIGGSASLIDIALHRCLSEIAITTPLSYEDIDNMLEALASVPRKRALETLAIRLKEGVDVDAVLRGISECLTELRTLTLEQPSVKPVNILLIVTESRKLFPRLRNFLLNRYAHEPPPCSSTTLPLEREVLKILERITDSALSLSFVCFGHMKWLRYLDGRSWSISMDCEMNKWWSEGLGRIDRRELENDRVMMPGLTAHTPGPWSIE